MKKLAKKKTGGGSDDKKPKEPSNSSIPRIKPKVYKSLEEKGKDIQRMESDRSAAERFMKGKPTSFTPKPLKKGGATKAKNLVKKQDGGQEPVIGGFMPMYMTDSVSETSPKKSEKKKDKLKTKVKNVVSNIKSKLVKRKPESSHTNVRFLWD